MTFATAVGTLVAGALGTLVAGGGGIISRFVPGVACLWNWTPAETGVAICSCPGVAPPLSSAPGHN